ncbi:MAG TPA: DUF4743 domain-containing protein, partial [Burkholderiaceae bacterium]|nr:DUF4743 domain-containing protein [Burkholderiaceae bacterium]
MHIARLQRLIARLQARAQPPLPADLITVRLAGVEVGHAQPAAARFVAQHVDGFCLSDGVLALPNDVDIATRTTVLAEAALRLRKAGLITGWRDEMLSISKPPVAQI